MKKNDLVFLLLLVVGIVGVGIFLYQSFIPYNAVKENEVTIPHQVFINRDKGAKYSWTALIKVMGDEVVKIKFNRKGAEDWLRAAPGSEIQIVLNNNTIAKAYTTEKLKEFSLPIGHTITSNFNEAETKDPRTE